MREVRPAYGAIYPESRERTFLGFYADLSALRPDMLHVAAVQLPEFQPGQFQGLFLENVETELTSAIAP